MGCAGRPYHQLVLGDGGLVPAPSRQEPLHAEDDVETAALPTLALGEDAFAFRVEVGGVVLPLPCAAAQLAGAGLVMQAQADERLPAGQMAEVEFLLEGEKVYLQLANTDTEPLPVGTCHVVGFAWRRETGGAAWRLPGGLGPASGEEEIQAALGQPNGTARQAQDELLYQAGRQAWLRFALDEEGRLKEFGMWNLFAPAVPEQSVSPEDAPAYQPPDELGRDWRSFALQCEGRLYSLPAPVAAFLADGWQLQDEGTLAPGHRLRGVSLRKGQRVLRTTLVNHSGSEQALAACHVTEIGSTQAALSPQVVLPGGVALGAAMDEVLAVYGQPDTNFHYMFSRYWFYLAQGGYVMLQFSLEEETLVCIEVSRR